MGILGSADYWHSKDLEVNEDRQNEWPSPPGKKIIGHFILTQWESQPWP